MNALALRVSAATLAVTWIAAASEAQQMERGSYLRKPANSRAQLISQLNSDPIVSARYQKHFGMSEEQVEQYFGTLTTTKIDESGRYLVWHVEPDGTIETKWLNLKAGTAVFADESGRPILKLNCGNPMVDQTVAKRTLPQEEVAVATPPPPVEETFVAEQPPVVALVPPPAIAVTEVVAAAPPVVTTTETVAVIPPPAVVTTSAPAAIGGGGIGAWPLLLVAGGIAGGGIGGGGGGTAPVPEPATFLAFGAGAAMLVARRRRKGQKSSTPA